MKIFKAFGMRDIQTMMLILNMSEGEGVTDLQILKGKMQDHVNKEYAAIKGTRFKSRVNKRKFIRPCPECDWNLSIVLTLQGRPLIEDGYGFLTCKKCRYGEMLKLTKSQLATGDK